MEKSRWIQHYSQRIFNLHLNWQSPLGIDPADIVHIKQNLEGYYKEPLKRALIETSY